MCLAAPAPCRRLPLQDLRTVCDQLPVEVPLGRPFVFRSIFACPVRRGRWGLRRMSCQGRDVRRTCCSLSRLRLPRTARPAHCSCHAPRVHASVQVHSGVLTSISVSVTPRASGSRTASF